MTFILRVLCIVLIVRNVCADTRENKLQRNTSKADILLLPNDGTTGVSSVAGVASRNGRVSSIGAVQFFSPFDHKLFMTENLEPSTVNKDSGDKLSKNPENANMDSFISIYPGFVSVSASSRTRNVGSNINPLTNRFDPSMWPMNTESMAVSSSTKTGNVGTNMNPWTNGFDPITWPITNSYSGPMNVIDYHRNLDMIHRDIFSNFVPPHLNYMKRNWIYPTFNPFLNY